jgi:hypothetical protein
VPLRVAAPVSVRRARRGIPSRLPDTLLAFGADGPGVSLLFDTSTDTAQRIELPTGYSAWDYHRWESTPFYGPLDRVGDRYVVAVTPKSVGVAPRLFALPTSLRPGEHLLLGDSGRYFLALDGQAVWVLGPAHSGVLTASEVDPDSGAVLARSAPISAASMPVAQVDGGFLSERPRSNGDQTVLTVVSPATGDTVRTISRRAAELTPVLAASPTTVIWQGRGPCGMCSIKIFNLLAGRTRTVRWTPPRRLICDEGALSPDGEWLAISYGCPRPNGEQGVLLMVNIRTTRAYLVPGSAQGEWGPPT